MGTQGLKEPDQKPAKGYRPPKECATCKYFAVPYYDPPCRECKTLYPYELYPDRYEKREE